MYVYVPDNRYAEPGCVCVCVFTTVCECTVCVCVCVCSLLCVCVLGWVKYREDISLLVIICISVYVTKTKRFQNL